jgi:WhiB family redox-sensing transcriptional regulator
MRREHWREDALCLDYPTTIFFPANTPSETRFDQAKGICKRCTVKKQCLKLAMNLQEDDDRWGVFGGMNPMERRVLRDQIKKGIKDAL